MVFLLSDIIFPATRRSHILLQQNQKHSMQPQTVRKPQIASPTTIFPRGYNL